MVILFSWTGVTSYMADCWRALQSLPGVTLKILVETADSGKAFQVAETLAGLDYELVQQAESATCSVVTLADDAFDPDIVFAGGWRSALTRRVIARYAHVPKVFCLDMPWRWSIRCVLARFALRSFVRAFEAVYVSGRSAARYAKWLGFPSDRLFMRLYAIDQSRFATPPNGTDEQSPNPQIGKSPRRGFLSVGRYSPEKRIDVIEQAYARYQSLGGTWPIDYYGQGGKFVQAAEMPRVYAEHACLLLASAFDPWPLVMLEARSAGLEVIASARCGNCAELGAIEVPYADVEAMAQAMLRVEKGERRACPDDLPLHDCQAWAIRTHDLAREIVCG